MTNAIKKIISLVVLICFAMTQTVTANPGAGIQIAPRYETPSFLQIDIPAELATLDGLYEAPPRSDPRLILHVQNAHANYDAQMKIKQLLEYLHKTYAFQTIFVEGAVETLDPEALQMFPDAERNQKLADLMAREGELNGAELFILGENEDYRPQTTDHSPKTDLGLPSPVSGLRSDGGAVQAHGIERADLYRENYEALKAVFGAETTVAKYLNGFEARLETLSSKVFSKDLRRVLAEWKKFEKGHREFMPYIHSLAAEAKRVLKIDLESLLAQIEWPQITRLLMLQSLEKDLHRDQALAEKDKLITFLKDKRVSPELLTAVKGFQDQRVSILRGGPGSVSSGIEPRDLMEKLMTEAGPKGFRFQDYPGFSIYAGYLILKNELDPKGLFQEIRTVFKRILDALAEGAAPVTQQKGTGPFSSAEKMSQSLQKQLLELYRDEELVRKLLNLELPRKEWQETVAKKDALEPKVLVSRLKKLIAEVEQDSEKTQTSATRNAQRATEEKAGAIRAPQGFDKKSPDTQHATKTSSVARSPLSSPKSAEFRVAVAAVQAAAFQFYEAAREREDVFYEKIDAVMTRGNLSKAVLVTGGFHTDGITDLLREHEINYGILTPRLTEKSNDKLYRNNMLQNHSSMFDLATLELFSLLQGSVETLTAQGAHPGKILDLQLSSFTRIFLNDPKNVEATLEFLGKYLARRWGVELSSGWNEGLKAWVVTFSRSGKVFGVPAQGETEARTLELRLTPLDNGKLSAASVLVPAPDAQVIPMSELAVHEEKPAARAESSEAIYTRQVAELIKEAARSWEGEGVIGVHGTSLEAILKLAQTGRLPNEGRHPGELYYYPFRETALDPHQVLYEARGYTEWNAKKHYVGSKIAERVSVPLSDPEYEDLSNYVEALESFEETKDLAAFCERHGISRRELDGWIQEVRAQKREGVLVFIAAPAGVTPRVGFDQIERVLDVQGGFSIGDIRAIEPAGPFEKEALARLKDQSLGTDSLREARTGRFVRAESRVDQAGAEKLAEEPIGNADKVMPKGPPAALFSNPAAGRQEARAGSRADSEEIIATADERKDGLEVLKVWGLPGGVSRFLRAVFDQLANWGVGPVISGSADHYRSIAENYGVDLDTEIAERIAGLENSRPLRVLDLGAGVAGYLQRLKDRYGDRIETIAVDSLYPAQERTRRGVVMIGGDAGDAVQKFREGGEAFDVVLSLNANSASRGFLLGSGQNLLNPNALVFIHAADFLNANHVAALVKQGYSVKNGETVILGARSEARGFHELRDAINAKYDTIEKMFGKGSFAVGTLSSLWITATKVAPAIAEDNVIAEPTQVLTYITSAFASVGTFLAFAGIAAVVTLFLYMASSVAAYYAKEHEVAELHQRYGVPLPAKDSRSMRSEARGFREGGTELSMARAAQIAYVGLSVLLMTWGVGFMILGVGKAVLPLLLTGLAASALSVGFLGGYVLFSMPAVLERGRTGDKKLILDSIPAPSEPPAKIPYDGAVDHAWEHGHLSPGLWNWLASGPVPANWGPHESGWKLHVDLSGEYGGNALNLVMGVFEKIAGKNIFFKFAKTSLVGNSLEGVEAGKWATVYIDQDAAQRMLDYFPGLAAIKNAVRWDDAKKKYVADKDSEVFAFAIGYVLDAVFRAGGIPVAQSPAFDPLGRQGDKLLPGTASGRFGVRYGAFRGDEVKMPDGTLARDSRAGWNPYGHKLSVPGNPEQFWRKNAIPILEVGIRRLGAMRSETRGGGDAVLQDSAATEQIPQVATDSTGLSSREMLQVLQTEIDAFNKEHPDNPFKLEFNDRPSALKFLTHRLVACWRTMIRGPMQFIAALPDLFILLVQGPVPAADPILKNGALAGVRVFSRPKTFAPLLAWLGLYKVISMATAGWWAPISFAMRRGEAQGVSLWKQIMSSILEIPINGPEIHPLLLLGGMGIVIGLFFYYRLRLRHDDATMHELLHAKQMFEVFKAAVEINALDKTADFIYGREVVDWEVQVGRLNKAVKTPAEYARIGERTRERFLSSSVREEAEGAKGFSGIRKDLPGYAAVLSLLNPAILIVGYWLLALPVAAKLSGLAALAILAAPIIVLVSAVLVTAFTYLLFSFEKRKTPEECQKIAEDQFARLQSDARSDPVLSAEWATGSYVVRSVDKSKDAYYDGKERRIGADGREIRELKISPFYMRMSSVSRYTLARRTLGFRFQDAADRIENVVGASPLLTALFYPAWMVYSTYETLKRVRFYRNPGVIAYIIMYGFISVLTASLAVPAIFLYSLITRGILRTWQDSRAIAQYLWRGQVSPRVVSPRSETSLAPGVPFVFNLTMGLMWVPLSLGILNLVARIFYEKPEIPAGGSWLVGVFAMTLGYLIGRDVLLAEIKKHEVRKGRLQASESGPRSEVRSVIPARAETRVEKPRATDPAARVSPEPSRAGLIGSPATQLSVRAETRAEARTGLDDIRYQTFTHYGEAARWLGSRMRWWDKGIFLPSAYYTEARRAGRGAILSSLKAVTDREPLPVMISESVDPVNVLGFRVNRKVFSILISEVSPKAAAVAEPVRGLHHTTLFEALEIIRNRAFYTTPGRITFYELKDGADLPRDVKPPLVFNFAADSMIRNDYFGHPSLSTRFEMPRGAHVFENAEAAPESFKDYAGSGLILKIEFTAEDARSSLDYLEKALTNNLIGEQEYRQLKVALEQMLRELGSVSKDGMRAKTPIEGQALRAETRSGAREDRRGVIMLSTPALAAWVVGLLAISGWAVWYGGFFDREDLTPTDRYEVSQWAEPEADSEVAMPLVETQAISDLKTPEIISRVRASFGDDTLGFQKMLVAKGLLEAKYADGKWGPWTEAATLRWLRGESGTPAAKPAVKVAKEATIAGPVALGDAMAKLLAARQRQSHVIVASALKAERAARSIPERDRIRSASSDIQRVIRDMYPGLSSAEMAGLHNLMLYTTYMETKAGFWKIQRNKKGPVMIAMGDTQVELATLGDIVEWYLVPGRKQAADVIAVRLGLRDGNDLDLMWKKILKEQGDNKARARKEIGKVIAARMFDPRYGTQGDTYLMHAFAAVMFQRANTPLARYSSPTLNDLSYAYDHYYRKGPKKTSSVRLEKAYTAVSGSLRKIPAEQPKRYSAPTTPARRSEMRGIDEEIAGFQRAVSKAGLWNAETPEVVQEGTWGDREPKYVLKDAAGQVIAEQISSEFFVFAEVAAEGNRPPSFFKITEPGGDPGLLVSEGSFYAEVAELNRKATDQESRIEAVPELLGAGMLAGAQQGLWIRMKDAGEDLLGRVNAGEDLPKVFSALARAARSMEILHERWGIRHGDFKPENVTIEGNIIDWEAGPAGTVRGTPGFLPLDKKDMKDKKVRISKGWPNTPEADVFAFVMSVIDLLDIMIYKLPGEKSSWKKYLVDLQNKYLGLIFDLHEVPVISKQERLEILSEEKPELSELELSELSERESYVRVHLRYKAMPDRFPVRAKAEMPPFGFLAQELAADSAEYALFDAARRDKSEAIEGETLSLSKVVVKISEGWEHVFRNSFTLLALLTHGLSKKTKSVQKEVLIEMIEILKELIGSLYPVKKENNVFLLMKRDSGSEETILVPPLVNGFEGQIPIGSMSADEVERMFPLSDRKNDLRKAVADLQAVLEAKIADLDKLGGTSLNEESCAFIETAVQVSHKAVFAVTGGIKNANMDRTEVLDQFGAARKLLAKAEKNVPASVANLAFAPYVSSAPASRAPAVEARAEMRSEQRVAPAASLAPVALGTTERSAAAQLAMEAMLAQSIEAEMALVKQREGAVAQPRGAVLRTEVKGLDAEALLKSLSVEERAAMEIKMVDVRQMAGVGVSDAEILVALLVGGILDLKKAGNIGEAKKEMMLLAATIGGNATVALKAAFEKVYPNSTLPASNDARLVIDILPAHVKLEAIEGMLALNPKLHYGLILSKTEAMEVKRRIKAWGDVNGVADISSRLHVSWAVSSANRATSVNAMLKASGLDSAVLMGNTAVVDDISQKSERINGAAYFIERGTKIGEELDAACIVSAVEFSATFKPDAVIKGTGNRFSFDLAGLQAVAKSLAAQLQGLISLAKSA